MGSEKDFRFITQSPGLLHRFEEKAITIIGDNLEEDLLKIVYKIDLAANASAVRCLQRHDSKSYRVGSSCRR
jgi:hypothetical protein